MINQERAEAQKRYDECMELDKEYLRTSRNIAKGRSQQVIKLNKAGWDLLKFYLKDLTLNVSLDGLQVILTASILDCPVHELSHNLSNCYVYYACSKLIIKLFENKNIALLAKDLSCQLDWTIFDKQAQVLIDKAKNIAEISPSYKEIIITK